MKKFILPIIAIFLVISCSDDSSTNSNKSVPTDSVMTARVIRIFDGDTFDCTVEGFTHRVRVLDIDCYETSRGERLTEQARRNGITVDEALDLGFKAKRLADSVLSGRNVQLYRSRYDANVDIYGRLLRYTKVNGISYDSLIKVRGLDAD